MQRRFSRRIGRNTLWLSALLLALVVAVGSGAPPAGNAARTAPPTRLLVVGGLLDLSSGWTSLGRASRVTLGLAAADVNARLAKAGEPLRVRLELVDVRGRPSEAVRQLRRLAGQGVRVFVGPESSAEVRAVRSAAGSLGVLVVSQGSTAHSIALAGDNVFRLVPDDRREAEALVALLKRDRIRALAPIWRDDAGNAGLVKSLSSRFKGVVSAGVSYGTGKPDFAAKVTALRRQVVALEARKIGNVAVYLAGFDEVVDLFHAASTDAMLGSVPWYGSDGVALTTRLVKDARAAAFANARGYPNPTLGLDSTAARRSADLRRRVRAKLGSRPDAFALTTYDALQIVARAAEQTGGVIQIRPFRRAFAKVAHGYQGVTGTIVLNAAGDRAYGSYDFWAVCLTGGGFAWHRTFSYLASGVGRGHIVRRQACRRAG
jgi:branched-chain amino acid transport system substrate-binding protein